MMDHGYPVNEDKRCSAMTKKQRRCELPPLAGIELCALHSGLARPRKDAAYGDRQALESYKRGIAAQIARRPGARAGA